MSYVKRYETAVHWIVAHCPAPDKFAHTYAGLIVWLASAVLLRRYSLIWPLLIVFGAEIANECVDRLEYGSWMWWDTFGDAAATWFWPAILTIALRLRLLPYRS